MPTYLMSSLEPVCTRFRIRQPRRRSALDYALGAALVLMSVALIAIVLAIVIIGKP